jgi:drug/metabolite transporter (DMT)-like permease
LITLDSISLIETVVPLLVAVIFTAISVVDIKKLFDEKVSSNLTPLWCFIGGFSWIAFGIVNLYGATTSYLVTFTWLYFAIGFIFFPILFFATMIQNINLTGNQRKADEERDEMRLE